MNPAIRRLLEALGWIAKEAIATAVDRHAASKPPTPPPLPKRRDMDDVKINRAWDGTFPIEIVDDRDKTPTDEHATPAGNKHGRRRG